MNGIYKFENLINHKIYIGQTTNLEERYKKHIKNIEDISHNEIFYKALRKYGIENFSYEILEQFDTLDENQLNLLEIFYINKYNSLVPNGYNMIPGGSNGSGIAKGKIVLQYDLKGNFIKEYRSAHAAAENTNINYSSICACCREEITHVKEFQWKYKDSDKIIKDLTKEKIIIKQRPILQYDLSGNLIGEYQSLNEAVKKTGCSRPVISNVCNHKGWTTGGYFWCFKDDEKRFEEFKKRRNLL